MSFKTSQTSANYVIPTAGEFKSSGFSKIISLVTFLGLIIVFLLFLYGLLSLLVAYIQFKDFNAQIAAETARYNAEFKAWEQLNPGADPKNFPGDPIQPPKDAEGKYLNPVSTLRFGIFSLIGAFLIFLPFKKLYNMYGEKTIRIDEDGIWIKQFKPTFRRSGSSFFTLFPTKFIAWEGILDIVVKQSDSVFTTFSPSLNKCVIYTMDESVTIEGISVQNQTELSNRLRSFSDSLEEKVIDFGYGAQLAIVWRRMKRSKVGVLGMGIVVFFSFIAVLAAVFMTISPINSLEAQYTEWTPFGLRNPNFINVKVIDHPPDFEYFMGTDEFGRDYFSRIFFGSFYSILIGIIATVISVVLGGFIGASSGYLGGVVDNIVMRIADVLMVLPGLPILIMIGATFTPLFKTLDIEGAYYIVVFSIFSLIGWSGTARYVRAEVLALKESEFIQAEHVLGASHYRIIVKHIIPNTMSTMIIIFTLGVAGNIQAVASLAFLGFGSQSTLVWGDDLARASGRPEFVLSNVWWGVTYVSLALFILTLGFNLMGDALRDALDPRLKN